MFIAKSRKIKKTRILRHLSNYRNSMWRFVCIPVQFVSLRVFCLPMLQLLIFLVRSPWMDALLCVYILTICACKHTYAGILGTVLYIQRILFILTYERVKFNFVQHF